MEYDSWLWGKTEPYCSLGRHMMAVGACATEYLQAPSSQGIMARLCDWTDLPREQLIHTFAYVAALHDIGKAHPTLQTEPGTGATTYKVPNYRHELYGAEILKELWKEKKWDGNSVALLCAVVRLHHQGKGGCDMTKRAKGRWLEYQRSLEARMDALFQPVDALGPFHNKDALGVIMTGVLILCDWVASSEGFAAESLPESEDVALLARLRGRARQTLIRYGLIDDEKSAYPRALSVHALFPEIPAEGVRPLQRTCEALGETRSLLTIVEAPMGEGKTEAALFLAGRLCEAFDKRGIYMALPTAATSNQMVGRVRRMLEAHQFGTARLLHGMAWLMDDKALPQSAFSTEDAGNAEDWLRPLRRGMLSENAVGTVDQAMAAALRIKYGFLRLTGLENKVLIVDEIHACDLFMSTIIARLLEWCRALEIPVILLSATLQNRQKQKYLACYGLHGVTGNPAYPLITQVTEEGTLRQTPVPGTYMRGKVRFETRASGCDADAIADLALRRVCEGGCLCVMLNTVRQAQAVYRALKARRESQLMLFHARYTAKRRAEIEKRCLDLFGRGAAGRPQRMILVCTQVVEQSLDVDFDGMITQLAPMDLLLQRAGRVHRHGGNKRPRAMERPLVEVIVPLAGATEKTDERYAQIGGVYPACAMRSTEAMLSGGRTVSVPEDVRACVEEAYRDISDREVEAAMKQMLKDLYSVNAAEGELLTTPNEDRFFAQTASVAQRLSLTDSNEDAFLRGAKTREGEDSRRFAFLPKDFPETDGSLSWARGMMEYSCSCRSRNGLTGVQKHDKIDENCKTKNEEKVIRGCIVLREDEDGLYRGGKYVFSYSDEYGVEEVPN